MYGAPSRPEGRSPLQAARCRRARCKRGPRAAIITSNSSSRRSRRSRSRPRPSRLPTNARAYGELHQTPRTTAHALLTRVALRHRPRATLSISWQTDDAATMPCHAMPYNTPHLPLCPAAARLMIRPRASYILHNHRADAGEYSLTATTTTINTTGRHHYHHHHHHL